MTRVARSPLVLAALLAIVAGALLWYASCMRTNASLAASPPSRALSQSPENPAVELEGALLLAGLNAQALTAVGVTAQSLAGVVDAFRDAYATHVAALTQAEDRMAGAHVSSDSLRRKIQSGKCNQEEVASYQSALGELEAAKTATEAALAACRAPAEAMLSQTQRDQLARIRANKHWAVPTEFLLVDRTEVQWVALREALANEKIAPRYGEEVDPQHASVLGSTRAHADVALAKSRLDSSLASIQSAFGAALTE